MSDETPQRTLTIVPYARRVEDPASGILACPIVPEFYGHAHRLLETLKQEGHSHHILLTADEYQGWQTAAAFEQVAKERGVFTDYAIDAKNSYADAMQVLSAHDEIRSAILIVHVGDAIGITGELDRERNVDTVLGLSAAIFRCGSAAWEDFSPDALQHRRTPLASSYTVLRYGSDSIFNYDPPKHIILLPQTGAEWNQRAKKWEVKAPENISDAALRLCDLKLSPHHILTAPSHASVATTTAFNRFRYGYDSNDSPPIETSSCLQPDSPNLSRVFDTLAQRPDANTVRRVMVVAAPAELERLTTRLGGGPGAYRAARHDPQILTLGEGVTWKDVSYTLQGRGPAKPLGIRFPA